MSDEIKQLSEECQYMISKDDLFIAYGNDWHTKPLNDIPVFSDGLGGYLTPNELESLSINNWKPIPLGENMKIAMLGGGNIMTLPTFLLTKFLALGADDIRADRDISEITYEELQNTNGFIVGFKSEINILQRLAAENETVS